MSDVKSFLSSKTIWGLVITAIGVFVDLPIETEEATTALQEIANHSIELVGLVIAFIGRVTASKKVTITGA